MKKSTVLASVFVISAMFTSCGNSSRSLQKKYRFNTNYYLGLQKLEENKISEAESNFTVAAKKGTGYCARYSEVELINIQNQRNRIELWQKHMQRYSDEEALLLACRDFFSCGEFSKVVSCTENIDLASADNELASLRLKSMSKKNDSRYRNEVYAWFTERPLSSEHYSFYKVRESDFSSQVETVEEDVEIPLIDEAVVPERMDFQTQVINFRVMVYRGIYQQAFSAAQELLMLGATEILPTLLYSDFGKAFYYGSKDYIKNASTLDTMITNTERKEELFYLNFYAGRLYDREGQFVSRAENRYLAAMENSCDEGKYDNALWYLLRLKLKKNTDRGVDALIQNCTLWHNPNYFDDILDLISNLLLTEGKWNEFYRVYKALDGNASDYMVSRFAYIYGRLLQEKLASPSSDGTKDSETLEREAFERALRSGSDYYYQILSMRQLSLSQEDTERELCRTVLNEAGEIDAEAETLLSGYAAFGFPEKIYPEFVKLSRRGSRISTDVMLSLSSFLKDCGERKNEFYAQSLRIASRAVRGADRFVSKKELELFFPRDYRSMIEKRCEKYGIPEKIMYALVRSESFFDSSVESSASAVGLTQLMEATAGDVAKKLKISQYNLKDPETNLEFGSFYMAELTRRLDGKWLPALLSYNTGITRIRKWMQMQKLPMDLFLEIAPYEETREYGRKLLSASCMYGWLYYNESIEDTVDFLLK